MRRFLPLAVFGTLVAASLFAAVLALRSVEDAARIKFEATADEAISRLEARIELHQTLLRATLAFMRASGGQVQRQRFDTFMGSLDIERRYPGVRGIGYARLVETGDEAEAERRILSNYGINRAIWPPKTEQALRTPIVLLEPLDERNQAALGFDMFSEPLRRAAMMEAMETGETRATGKVALVQDQMNEEVPGFLVYLPLRETIAGARGRGAVRGFVYAPFRAGDFFNAALGRQPLLPLNLEIHDEDVAEESLLFRSPTPPAPSIGNLVTQRQLTFSGRDWIVTFRPSAGFEPPSSPLIALAIGLVGVLLAAALAMVVRYQERAYEAVEAMQRSTESSLQAKELMLQEMKHRIKNSIARVLAIARQTASGADSIQDFSASFAARLQAMAASQDMLTRSRWQKANLKELLETELAQVFGRELDRQTLDGPEVLLDEATTQALGLTFHELATNALKYGNQDSRIRVEWRTAGRAANRRLLLSWVETGKAVVPPEKTGFGTRLIEMNVERELGGSITREYGATGMTIRIEVPIPGRQA